MGNETNKVARGQKKTKGGSKSKGGAKARGSGTPAEARGTVPWCGRSGVERRGRKGPGIKGLRCTKGKIW